MLTLTRRTYQTIHIGKDVVITVVAIQGKQVRIGIEAPREIPVIRGEILDSWTPEEAES